MEHQCRICRTRPVIPSRLRKRDYICGRCMNDRPSQKASRAKYRASGRWHDVNAAANVRKNPRRIFIGKQYHSQADSPETARVVNEHIKERMACHFQGTRGKNAS